MNKRPLLVGIMLILAIAACNLNQPFAAPTFEPNSRSTLEALGTEIARAAENVRITVEADLLPDTGRAGIAPAFNGIWTNDQGEVLVLSGDTIYHRFLQNEVAFEHFGDVEGYQANADNPASGEIVYMLRRIRMDNEDTGFDAPRNRALVELDGDSLHYRVLIDPDNPAAGNRYETTLTRAFD